ncbi:LysR family transcriptional regulator [Lampropedia puyangensis]|uniref:LysR family transcriptional regulator n=1 Tax=Lampropedia puyangensis TaxID=1330072 RepID=A0A4S8FEM5_9BURK|nr:LysR family transcriptional regulator [Lampropedia puyangensis]THU05491.1 LysR family transcriptional regulator [Lampropedia puyangensis]
MAINIKYRALKAFLLVAQTRSFTYAANDLGVTQPSLTALIHDLEETVGMRLFERSTRHVELTEAGGEFLSRIMRPLGDIEDAYASAVTHAKGEIGSISIGSLPSAAMGMLPIAMAQLRRSHPALRTKIIEMHNDQLLEMIRSNQIECAIGAMTESTQDLDFEPLIGDAFYLIVYPSHAFESRQRLYWRNIQKKELIVLAQGSNARAQIERELPDLDGEEKNEPQYDVTHIVTALNLVRQQVGVTVVPGLSMLGLHLNGLHIKRLQDANAQRRIGIIKRKGKFLSPATTMLLNTLRSIAPSVEKKLESLNVRTDVDRAKRSFS